MEATFVRDWAGTRRDRVPHIFQRQLVALPTADRDKCILEPFQGHLDGAVLGNERVYVRPVGFKECLVCGNDALGRGGVDRDAGNGFISLQQHLYNQSPHRVTDQDRFFLQHVDQVGIMLRSPG